MIPQEPYYDGGYADPRGSLIDTIDNMNSLMMHLSGISLEMMIAKQQKKEEGAKS